MSLEAAPPIVVRSVWQKNLLEEFELIRQCSSEFRFVSMDTEFPGTVFHLDFPNHVVASLAPIHHYSAMKQNVDVLNIIQLGLTLSNSDGHLPSFGTESQYVWEFNFRDFDVDNDVHNEDSIALLRRQGIDFSKNRRDGIDSLDFARCFLNSWLGPVSTGRAWVTFHGLYDFGFLVKILFRKPLPADLTDFMRLVHFYFGVQVYDLKPVSRIFGMRGGLEKVAECLGLGRAAGKSHQAGSDSLLTMHSFLQLVKMNHSVMQNFNYMLYGLTCKS